MDFNILFCQEIRNIHKIISNSNKYNLRLFTENFLCAKLTCTDCILTNGMHFMMKHYLWLHVISLSLGLHVCQAFTVGSHCHATRTWFRHKTPCLWFPTLFPWEYLNLSHMCPDLCSCSCGPIRAFSVLRQASHQEYLGAALLLWNKAEIQRREFKQVVKCHTAEQ